MSGKVLWAMLDNIAIEYSMIDSGLNFQPVNERIFEPVKISQAKIGAANGGLISVRREGAH